MGSFKGCVERFMLKATNANSRWARWLFYLFFILFSLLPLSFAFFVPIVFLVYGVCLAFFLVALIKGWRWKQAVAWPSALLYTAIYISFGLYSLLLSNAEPELIFKDSVGFIFYPVYFPLVALMVVGRINRFDWERFLTILGVLVAIFHVAAYFAFYQLFGELTNVTIIGVNDILQSAGTASTYGASGGVLRVDSKLGILMVIPILIIIRNMVQNKAKLHDVIAIMILFVGVILEGHRAIIVALMFSSILYAIWIILRTKGYAKRLNSLVRMTLLLCVCLIAAAALYGDDLSLVLERYAEVGSSAGVDEGRASQFPALIDKILESPILGSGFGSHASVLRSIERPFMYELDYLAVFMKLGILGGVSYFAAYGYLMFLSARKSHAGTSKMVYFFSGLTFFLFAATNGGMAMSPSSALSHLYLMIGLSVEYFQVNRFTTSENSKYN